MSKVCENISVQELVNDFLSGYPSQVLDASHRVINLAVQNRLLIEALVPYLGGIINATSGLSYGGAILSNERFVRRAIDIIDASQTSECLCKFMFEPFGYNAESFAKAYDFLLIEPSKSEGFIRTGVVQCPVCKNKYEVTEEYTGWHTTTTTYKKL